MLGGRRTPPAPCGCRASGTHCLLAEYAGIVPAVPADHGAVPRRLARAPFSAHLGWVWTMLKTLVLSFVVIWLRVS